MPLKPNLFAFQSLFVTNLILLQFLCKLGLASCSSTKLFFVSPAIGLRLFEIVLFFLFSLLKHGRATSKKRVLSDEAKAKLAQARELANAKRKELAEMRKASKEALVQQKMEEVQQKRTERLEKQAMREAKKRVTDCGCSDSPASPPKPPKKSKDAVVVEYSSSDSDDIDFDQARVLFVKKDRPKNSEQPVTKPIPPAPDPLMGAYRDMFGRRF